MNNENKKIINKIKKATIYEVNIRQYTPEGTFNAFEKHLPRLKQLGVEIIWLMPVQTIGEKNKKGKLGSYYSVRNFTKINPEFGTKKDLQNLINHIHSLKMLVILDWVANHSAWDNIWIKQHPEWYVQDKNGNIIPPNKDWTDVADLNYNNPEMQKEMINAMKFWIKNFNIDGFRCDMAMLVPTTFWEKLRKELNKIKPIFMLAEAEEPELMKYAFDANYAWKLLHLTEDIAKQNRKPTDLIDYFINEPKKFPENSIPMNFTSNHDENAWNGHVHLRYPNKSHITFAAFTFVIPGIPLIYSGQEAGLNKKLKFFDKDTIEWKKSEMSEIYQKLIKLKKNNKALWTDQNNSTIKLMPTETNENISTFVREKENNKILCLFNLSNHNTSVKYITPKAIGTYKDYFSGKIIKITLENWQKLNPWQFMILIKI